LAVLLAPLARDPRESSIGALAFTAPCRQSPFTPPCCG